MTKFTHIILTMLLSLIILGACAKHPDNTARIKARELFVRSMTLSNKYIDSISNASDSIGLLTLIKRYDDSLTALNYKYPAGTDYDLAEGENDTLKYLSARILILRDSLLYAYAHPHNNDTIVNEPLDSIAQ